MYVPTHTYKKASPGCSSLRKALQSRTIQRLSCNFAAKNTAVDDRR